MTNELLRQAKGLEPVPSRDRRVAKKGKQTLDDVRLAALQVQGSIALAQHIIEGQVELDRRVRHEAGGDPIVMGIVAEFQANSIRQCKTIQSGLFDEWR